MSGQGTASSTVAIVGSGPVGSAMAFLLAQRGHDVVVFEKGPEYPHPHEPQFEEQILYQYQNPARVLPSDLKHVDVCGRYQMDLNRDLYMNVGGAGTRWSGIALRMIPSDFRTRTRFGYGVDWPIDYDELEPYYCSAEALLGVAGTDADNPFAPPRSKPHPLPPFELGDDDLKLAARLKAHGIVLHSTPQARTRAAYDDRPACMNFGVCWVCPIGARYSPNHHLKKAVETGRCRVVANTTVRRVLVDRNGAARGVVVRGNDDHEDREHAARVVIVAGSAFESIRLLMLSADERHPGGLGNHSGHLGKHLLFHHAWNGKLRYEEPIYPARFGGWTGQSHQFMDKETGSKRGGIKVEFPFLGEPGLFFKVNAEHWKNGADVVADMREAKRWYPIRMHSEAIEGPEKFVTLSTRRDRFGDPFACVSYDINDRDRETYGFAQGLFDRYVKATGADQFEFADQFGFNTSSHHMGGCRMSSVPEDGVVDSFGAIHGAKNLYALGGSTFASSGSVNPTLTMVAIAIRAADRLLEQMS
jgi:choline dehydrogenase-like flavoprotein